MQETAPAPAAKPTKRKAGGMPVCGLCKRTYPRKFMLRGLNTDFIACGACAARSAQMKNDGDAHRVKKHLRILAKSCRAYDRGLRRQEVES